MYVLTYTPNLPTQDKKELLQNSLRHLPIKAVVEALETFLTEQLSSASANVNPTNKLREYLVNSPPLDDNEDQQLVVLKFFPEISNAYALHVYLFLAKQIK